MSKNTLAILLLISCSTVFSAHAESGPATVILQEHLSRVRLSEATDPEEIVLYSDLSAFLNDLMASLQKNAGLCAKSGSDQKLARCLRTGFRSLTRHALSSGAIDEVTAKNLGELSGYFSAEKGRFKILPPKDDKPGLVQKFLNLFKRKRLPNGKTQLPGLLRYLQQKNFFSYRRVDASEPKVLDPELLEKMESIYLRRVKSVGRANPEEYLLSKYSRGQIWALSDLMKKTVAYRNSNAGKLVLAKKNYRAKFEQIEKLEAEIAELVDSVAVQEGDSESSDVFKAEQDGIEAKRKEIDAIRLTITPVVQQAIIDRSKNEKKALQVELVREVSEEKRTSLYDEIVARDQAIADAQAVIDQEYVEIELTQGDVRRFAVNWLHRALGEEELYGNLKGMNPNFADVVGASLITGEVRSVLIEGILDLEPFKEPKHVALKQWGNVALSIAKTLSYLNPYTATAMTIGSVVFESVRSQKAYAKEQAKSDDLIH